MENALVLKEYYVRYLRNIRQVSESTVKHYVDALNNISRCLKEKDLIQTDIYEVLDIEQLEKLREILYADPHFISQDKRGHQMYSAGLNNYCKFANGVGFERAKKKSRCLMCQFHPLTDTPLMRSVGIGQIFSEGRP